jgi:hypothetical protein
MSGVKPAYSWRGGVEYSIFAPASRRATATLLFTVQPVKRNKKKEPNDVYKVPVP